MRKNNDEIIEIEEFKIEDKRIVKLDINKLEKKKRDIEKEYNITTSFKDNEPFSTFLGKQFYIVGHSVDGLFYGPDDNWYLESKQYIDLEVKGRQIINQRNIYRFIFTGDLPQEIKNIFPESALQAARKGIVGTDIIIELPVMSGIVIMIPAWNGTPLYYIKNPKINVYKGAD